MPQPKLKTTKTLLVVLLFSFALAFGIYWVSVRNKTVFKLQLSELNYKFQPAAFVRNPEIAILQQRIAQNEGSSDIELAALAELFIAEAKRSGSTDYYAQAETLAKSALNVNNKNKTAHTVLIKIMIARHQFQDALTKVNNLFSDALTTDSASLRAAIYMAVGRLPEALTQINFLVRAKPDLGSATLKALVLAQMGQDDLALHYFQRAIKIEDLNEELQSVFTRGQLAQLLIKKGNASQAIQLCDVALKIVPEHPFLLYVKAQAYVSQKNYKQAFALFQTAFAQSKEPVYLLNMVFVTKIMKNDADFKILSQQALTIYESESDSDSYGHLIDLAELHYVMGNFEKALLVLRKNEKLRKTFRSEVALAKTLMMLDKFEDARDIIEAQIAIGATDVSVYYLMLDLAKGDLNDRLRKALLDRIRIHNPKFNAEILMIIP